MTVVQLAGALAVAVSLIGGTQLLGDDVRPVAARTQLQNVERALEGVPSTAIPARFDVADLQVPRGGHLQGIQLCWDPTGKRWIALLSHDSETVAYLVIAGLPADLIGSGRLLRIHELAGDGQLPPLRHAGGMQLVGDVLAIGLEDNQLKTRSEIQFWNVANPLDPKALSHLTIRRAGAPKEQTAGAVGLLRRATGHLLAVANWDSRAIDLYVSNGKPLDDPLCRFEFNARWSAATAGRDDWRPDDVDGSYQSINLVSDAKGAVYLLGFQTNLAGADVVDLFAVELAREPGKLLRKVGSKRITLHGQNHFLYAGGAVIHAGELWILSGPRELERLTPIAIARPAH
jgi:hypothetical protein